MLLCYSCLSSACTEQHGVCKPKILHDLYKVKEEVHDDGEGFSPTTLAMIQQLDDSAESKQIIEELRAVKGRRSFAKFQTCPNNLLDVVERVLVMLLTQLMHPA
jgi:hypothetical protein